MINFQVVKTVGRFIGRNAPIILTGLGVAGVAGTTVMAVKESKKKNPNYTATVVVGVLTAGCIIGGAGLQAMRTKEIADAFNNLAHRMTNYRTAINELGAAAVIDSVSRMETSDPEEMEHIVDDVVNKGDLRYEEKLHWFWDEYSNTWFKGTWKQVYYANMVLQKEYTREGFAPICIYYNCLDLPFADECPTNLGFSRENVLYIWGEDEIPFDYDDVTAPNGDPGFAVSWKIEPEVDLDVEDGYLH